ncbi:MAG: tripartite tricarboxylate transporter substrate binding protein [Burkholderiales bacterium]|nr:tripartite tricarboxylate transporter substrate binding protein [Burkholderiales bacterium]
MNRRRDVVVGAAAAVALGWSGGARSQGAYPTRAVKLIVPYPPGGSTDILARAFSEQLAKQLGQPVVIDNRPGAQTNIGTEAAARSTPDGYTVYFGTSGLASNPHFGPAPSIDVLKDLAPIGMIASMSFVVAANPALPATDGASLIALARSRPGKVTIASASLETQVLTLNKRARVELMHVPYKGGAQAAADTMAGHTDTVIALVPVLLPHIQTGRLKALALCSPKRSASLPKVPTFKEAGVADAPAPSWFAMFAPAGVPEPILARLAAATQAAAATPELVAKMTAQGIDMQTSTPAELGETLKREYAEQAALFKELK